MGKRTILAGLFILMTGIVAQAQQVDRPKITVNGEAVVNVKPDKIVISLGIETSDADISAAKLKNNDIMKRSVAAMKEMGIPDKDIQTDYLSVQPRWNDEYTRNSFLGYFVRNTLVVTLADATKLEGLVTRMLQSGVNYIHGVDFQVSDLKKYREQARELALRAAKEKAEKMSAVLGRTIAAPIQVNEAYSGPSYRYWSSWGGWGGGRSSAGNVQVQANAGDAGEIGDTIAVGMLSVRAGVSVTFEIK